MESTRMENNPDARHGSPWRLWLALVILVLLALGALYLWKMWSERQMSAQYETTQQAVLQRSRQALTQQSIELLRFSTIPLTWAIRKDMMAGNLGQINSYFMELIREPYVRQISLIRPDGLILLSTNKKLEGQRIEAAFPAALLNVSKPEVTQDAQGNIRIAQPVMGLNQKLGLLVVSYAGDSIQQKMATISGAESKAPSQQPAS